MEADEEKCPILDWMQLSKLLSADDLCVDSEENVYNCILRWLMSSSTIVLGNEAGEYDKATEVTSTNLIKEEGDLIHLWESV
eukprot:08981.XXX_98250_96527_1 [CDS] Oithona nana genome sequencing.